MHTFNIAESAPSILLLLIPILLSYLPLIHRILTTTNLIKRLVQLTKLTQFTYRLAPYLVSHATYIDLLRQYAVDTWLRWRSRTWMWLAGRAGKEVMRLVGVPGELFDVVEECVWGGWCFGMPTGMDMGWKAATKTEVGNTTATVVHAVGRVVEGVVGL